MSIFFGSADVNDNEDEDISPQQKALLLGISYPITFLSLCAGIVVITLFVRTWKNCSQIGKMGFCLTLANLIYTLTNLLPIILNSSADYFCYIDGPLRMFSTLSCIVWATKIAITAFRALVTEEYHPSHPLGVNWGFIVPTVVALCPLIPEGRYYIYYDTLGLNCNVDSKVKILRRVWPIMFNIIPMIVSVVLTIYSNIKIIRFLKSQRTPFKIRTKRFIAYPLSLIIAWMPLNVFRFMYFVTSYNIWLDGIAIVFSRSSGLINAIMYGWERLKAAHDINNNEILQEMCTKTAMEENTDMEDSFSDLSLTIEEEYMRKSSMHKL